MLLRVTRNGALFDKRPIEAIVPIRDSPALLVDVLLRLESVNEALDSLLLSLAGSGGLRLFRIVQRPGEITS